jgi:hypothetical protein
MTVGVVARAEQSLLFAAPERDADGAARLESGGVEDAQHFHHRRRAGGVVGGAGRAVPRIEVRANQHDVVLEVRARQFANHVEAVRLGFVAELDLDVERHLHRHVVLEQPDHPVVVLDRDGDLRQAAAGGRVAGAAGAEKHRAAVDDLRLPGQIAAAGAHVAVGAAIDERNARLRPERTD